jgi:hypothetical protein
MTLIVSERGQCIDDAGVNGCFRRAPASAQNMKTPKASA